ncbi:AraC family transcriptional regulator [Empedobacter brevis]|uniref:AraC family transcriptional regulator n=1 Tax=Flavobacteriales TaxID=200644 RepID=UPI001320075E|nr:MULTISPECIES: helix-turn-helix domain-containing protein [Flavobacteriales]QHC86200.1 AraC family transcriptional regulator [Empedobacter brevis]
MQTTKVPVCNMGLFNSNDFWMSSIDGLLINFPHLEFPHENTFYTLFIIENGNGEIIIDQNRSRIDNSQIIIIKPNCITEIYLKKEAKGKMICFTEDFFSLRYNNNILNQFTFFNETSEILIRITTNKLSYINFLTSCMYEEFNSKKKASKKVLRSFLNILLIEAQRIHTPLRIMNENTPTKEKVQKFQKLIEKNFKMSKMPSDYAKMLNISTNYLNKICKTTLGLTSGDLIRKQIILEAQRLLHYTNYTINEIANELGFEHPSYFVTLFKKITNLTPEQYRKKRNE